MIITGFGALDELSGGLQEKKNYLVYGNMGTGKTTFCLQFLYQGLLNGETVGLVTRRSARTVFERASGLGLDLEPFARTHQFILFEYVPRVVENSLRLRDPDQISAEFEAFLGTDTVQRLAFDPLTPLLSSPSSSTATFRARSLIQSFSEFQAACLYVFDTPEGEDYLASCKDFVYGVLRFEAAAFASAHGRMILERFTELKTGPRQFEFEIVPGEGLVGVRASDPSAPAQGGGAPRRRKVLLIVPDNKQRELFRGLLEKSFEVLDADGGADGLAKVAVESPDLIVLEKESEGLDGLEICRKLRQNKLNVPVVLISNQIRRARDRVETMAAGADECLERPVDGRILKLKIQQLLRRYDASRDRLGVGGLDATVTLALDRDKTTSTTNLAYFYDRVRQEMTYSMENALSFALLTLRLPDGSSARQELFEFASSLIREYDLVYVGNQGVAVLLGEIDEKGVNMFLNRFNQRWKSTPAPAVEHRQFDRREDFLETAKRLVNGIVGAESPTAGGAPARA